MTRSTLSLSPPPLPLSPLYPEQGEVLSLWLESPEERFDGNDNKQI